MIHLMIHSFEKNPKRLSLNINIFAIPQGGENGVFFKPLPHHIV